MKLAFNHWIFLFWPFEKYDAITMPWAIYFKNPGKYVDPGLIVHELTHIDQIKKDGAIKFYTRYVWKYVLNRIKGHSHDAAYRMIPYEVEAYKAQESCYNG